MRATRLGVLRRPSRSGCSPTARSSSRTAASEAAISIALSRSKSSAMSSSNSTLSIFSSEPARPVPPVSPDSRSADLRLDQPVRPVAAAIEHADAAGLAIIEDKEVVVPELVHLLDGFQLVHWQDPELLALGDHGRQLIGDLRRGGLLHCLADRLAIAAAVIVLALITIDLPVELVERG